jgi:hypothetical protein
MHSLEAIVAMNERACRVKVEDNHNRECSWQGDPLHGVVVHSAKYRNTVYLVGGKAKRFIAKWWSTTDQNLRNHYAEALFA